ncbi:MAG: hypothetical protein DME89_06940 [Verrucomicrobia bacterium]|nr:MAG: hypothetical protein DME89_06940 [Verrucomicrobiota bacterium]
MKAPAGICMVFWPCTTGEALKWKVMPVPATPSSSAGVPLTVKSLGWTLDGSTGAPMLTTKSVTWVKTVLSQAGWVPITVHCASLADGDAAGVVVAVGVAVAVGVGVGVGVGVDAW